MKLFRLLLFPFSLLYGLAVALRNFGYDWGILKSHSFKIPIISVGNLTVGGSGKSPMVEYLIRVLRPRFTDLAILSRGYGRSSKGFRILDNRSTSNEGGDEPVQFKQKFFGLTVAVAEDRVFGINKLISISRLIILDDAFQHRAVKPGLSILLFDYNRLHEPNLLLPAGNLREPRIGRRRADIIVITKCPDQLDENVRSAIKIQIAPFSNQHLFYAGLRYGQLKALSKQTRDFYIDEASGFDIFLLTGIASAKPLYDFLASNGCNIDHHEYPDHYKFTSQNIFKLTEAYKTSASSRKIIITTEKDAQRLRVPEIDKLINNLPVYYLPVETYILEPDSNRFNELIINYATKSNPHN